MNIATKPENTDAFFSLFNPPRIWGNLVRWPEIKVSKASTQAKINEHYSNVNDF